MPEYVTLILKSILRPESDQSSEINQSVLLELQGKSCHYLAFGKRINLGETMKIRCLQF